MSTSTVERTRLLDHAKSIVETAKSLRRELTPDENSEVEADMAKIKALDVGTATKTPNYVQQVMALGSADDFDPEGQPRGNLFSEAAKAGIVHAVKSRTAFRTELQSKALTSGTLLPTSGSLTQGGLHPNSQFPLAGLFQNVAADGPLVRYYRMSAGSAAVVAEGQVKPDSGVAITPVDLIVSKLACLAVFSDEMADDASFLVSHLQTELVAAVAAAENRLILDTFAATSGVQTGTSTTAAVVDAVADAISAQEALSGVTPGAVIAHPSVVAAIRKSKASTSGTYVLDPLTAGPTTLHGVRVVSTPGVAAGTAWVVEPSGVVVYRRANLVVEVGTDGGDFSHNTKTMRAEERVAAAVIRPSSLTKLTLT